MGNTYCRCCSKRDRSVEDLLDGSLEDKLLGKAEEDVEATTAEDEAWRQRREQLKDEEEMSMGDGDDAVRESMNAEPDMAHASLIWDLSDRNTVKVVRKEAGDLVEDEEDEEEFGSAKEDDEDDQESKEHVDGNGTFSEDRLTQLSARSDTEDSYASVNDYFRGEDTRVFRDTELDRATEVSDTFLASTSPSSLRGTVTNSSFMVDDEEERQKEQQQKEEHEGDQAEDEDGETGKRRSSSGSRRRSSKKKSRSRKSMRK
jgi:hypothetical protein